MFELSDSLYTIKFARMPPICLIRTNDSAISLRDFLSQQAVITTKLEMDGTGKIFLFFAETAMTKKAMYSVADAHCKQW